MTELNIFFMVMAEASGLTKVSVWWYFLMGNVESMLSTSWADAPVIGHMVEYALTYE